MSGTLALPHRTAPVHCSMTLSKTIRAILTDVQFWVPAAVLALGVALLVMLH
jgi:hypothetical protein